MSRDFHDKILPLDALASKVRDSRMGRVALTNGCFDVLHRGHVEYLAFARSHADLLIVAINSDASVRRLKGPGRPVNTEVDRACVLAALEAVDFVTIFDEDTPLAVVSQLRPDVLVKGADYTVEQVVGAAEVLAYGGQVKLAPLVDGHSTTSLLQRSRTLPPDD